MYIINDSKLSIRGNTKQPLLKPDNIRDLFLVVREAICDCFATVFVLNVLGQSVIRHGLI